MAWPTTLQPVMTKAMENSTVQLARAGARISECTLPQPFEASFAAQRKMNDYEAWRALSHERLAHADQLSSTLSARLKEAELCTFDAYREAQAVISGCRALLDGIFEKYDVLLTPSVPAEAPEGLTNTGDSTFIRIWTAFHTPTVNLPVFQGEKGLPMGLQVIGPYGEDRRTLDHADWIYRVLTA
jgi:Asp-tRNA(Asn)/Glu-tRNA(Gln) amidotransferase A subunit family amidase